MNILMVLTNYTKLGDTKKKTGYYLKELAYPYMFLKKNGHNIDLCSPRGFKTKPDPLSLNYSTDQVIIEFYENTKMQKKLEMTPFALEGLSLTNVCMNSLALPKILSASKETFPIEA